MGVFAFVVPPATAELCKRESKRRKQRYEDTHAPPTQTSAHAETTQQTGPTKNHQQVDQVSYRKLA